MEDKKQKNNQQKTNADGKETAQKGKEHRAVLLKYPKNIRQMGEAGEGKRIYVEDYVMTLMMYLAGKTKDGYGSAVLLGKKAVVEGQGALFISGAIEILQQWRRPEEISGVQWTFVYDQIQKYFQDTEILGWFLTHPGMEPVPDEAIRAVWRTCFDGAGKVLFLYDNISREEAFYVCKDGEFEKQSGYYIYYEKNEEMQNYMIEVKDGRSSDEGYRDVASEKIRQKFEKKQEMQKRNLLQQQAAYTVGILAGAVILAAAAGTLKERSGQESTTGSTQEVEALSKKNEWVLGKEQKTENTIETAENQEENRNEKKTEEENEEGSEEGSQEETAPSGKEADEETENQSESKPSEMEAENTGSEEKTTDGKKQENSSEDETIQTQTEGNQETAQKNNTSSKKKKKKRYEVKKGDTLESISIAWYGSSSYVKKIKRINHLENADKIYIGQVLILP